MAKNGKLPVEPYKGVRDFYPEDQAFLNYLFSTWREVAQKFGYVEYHASILEHAEMYKAKGAENEELINEQTYTFKDRGGREVTLRPEMTPSVARMVAARRRELGFPLRLFSIPNVFRYERPQRGRLREHWQLNADIFGSHTPAADAGVIHLAHAIMLAFGAKESDFEIRLNSRAALSGLIERLGLSGKDGNVLLKLLDRRAKISNEEFVGELKKIGVAPEALVSSDVPQDVQEVLALLGARGVGNAAYHPGTVRGFDYYTGVVFEVFDTHPANNRSMFGGGRYDNLTQLFDEESVSAVGFGMGDVTVRDFLDVRGLIPPYISPVRVYLAQASEDVAAETEKLATELRKQNVNVEVDLGEKKLADQIKTASKHAIPYLVVVGSREVESGTFVVRDLESGKEETLRREKLGAFFLSV